MKSGFSFIELIITVGILSTVVLAIGALNLMLSKQSNQTSSLIQLDIFRRNLNALIVDTNSWKNTTIEGSAAGAKPAGKMDCLANVQPCTVDGTAGGQPIRDQSFAIYDGANNLFFDSTVASNGLTRSGLLCNTYPSAECSFRFDLKWTANCTPGNCVDPQVKVSAMLVRFEEANALTVNTANFSIPAIFRKAQ